jgi:hypothetical protein
MSASFNSPGTFTNPVSCKETDGLRVVGGEEEETVGVLVEVLVVVPPHALQKKLTTTSTQRRNQRWAGLFVNIYSSFSLAGRQAMRPM